MRSSSGLAIDLLYSNSDLMNNPAINCWVESHGVADVYESILPRHPGKPAATRQFVVKEVELDFTVHGCSPKKRANQLGHLYTSHDARWVGTNDDGSFNPSKIKGYQ